MSIICELAPRALEAARALEPIFGRIVASDRGSLLAAADAADLIVLSAERPDNASKHIAHVATVPLLVVRDPDPFVRWSAGRAPLRAVLGWDETETTVAALDPLVAMRRHAPIDLDVVHVYFPDEAAPRYGLHATSMVDPMPALEALLARDIAHELGNVSGGGTLTVTPALGLGHVGQHVLERARDAELVVVGTHHREKLRRLSSVAERVLDGAPGSILLVPSCADAPLHRVPDFRVAVVATDGSAFANYAVPYAYRLVPEAGEVHIVRVVAGSESADDTALVDDLMALRPDVPTRTVAHVVRDNDPAHAIAVAAEQIGADVVCIAAHTHTRLARTFTSSVTDRLLATCRRPVLVLHPSE
jgi:nucleotide-binding universal stress UspA family protein